MTRYRVTNKPRLAAFVLAAVLLTCVCLYAHAAAQGAVSPVAATANAAGGTPAPVVKPPEKGAQAAQQPIPQEILQRTAFLALRGDFGKLADWQIHWYKLAQAGGWTAQGTLRVTGYGPFDGTRYGNGWKYFSLMCGEGPPGTYLCDDAIVSAPTPCEDCEIGLPKGSIVWCDLGLRFVGDRGGAVKHHWDLWGRHDLTDDRRHPYRILRRGYGGEGNPPLHRAD